MRKRLSRRRLKARIRRYRAVPLHDVWTRDLTAWIRRFQYHVTPELNVRRNDPVITLTLEEYSAHNVRMFMLGDLEDDATQD